MTSLAAPETDDSTPRTILVRLRQILAATFLLGSAGAAGELFLLEHTETTWQIVPLAILGVGAVAMLAALVTRRAIAIRILQVVLLASVVSAGFGFWWHLDANLAFEREMDPDLHGLPLVWKSLHGTAPPALAPGTMALLGVLGLAWSYRNPALDRSK